MTTASQIQRFFNVEKARRQKSYTPQEKLELVKQCEGLSKREVERHLVTVSPEWAEEKQERQRVVRNGKTELTLQIDKDATRDLERVKELRGNTSLGDIFQEALRCYREKLEKKHGYRPRTQKIPSECVALPTTDPMTEMPSTTRYTKVAAREDVAAHSGGQCEFTDPKTGRRCTSRYRLPYCSPQISRHLKSATSL
jgi:hypothetical protein